MDTLEGGGGRGEGESANGMQCGRRRRISEPGGYGIGTMGDGG